MPTQEQYEESDAGKAETKRIGDHFAEMFGTAPVPAQDRIKKLQDERMGINMKDRWSEADHKRMYEIAEEIRKLEQDHSMERIVP